MADPAEDPVEAMMSAGRHGVYDVTVRWGDEAVAEFRGRSHQLAGRT